MTIHREKSAFKTGVTYMGSWLFALLIPAAVITWAFDQPLRVFFIIMALAAFVGMAHGVRVATAKSKQS